MTNVILMVSEDNHGFICLAESYRAAISYLVRHKWVGATTPTIESDDNFSEAMGIDDPTDRELIDWIVENTDITSECWSDWLYFDEETIVLE